MKKIMTLAAIVCAAVVAQASSVDWQVAAKNSTLQKGKAVYIFDAADRTSILALLEAGTSNAKAAEIINSSTWQTAVKDSGEISSTTTPSAVGTFDLGSGVASGTSGNYFAIVFNQGEANVASATKYFVSDDAPGKSYTADKPTDRMVVEMSIAAKSSVAITQSIPEPTSGLLLLLGVAGLALKRKHA